MNRGIDVADFIERYSRQILVLGIKKQLKLAESRIAIIGCGATGSSVAEVLARAGAGFIRVVDRDVVEVSNLHRTRLFREEDAFGRVPKAIACRNRLKEINSGVEVEAIVDDVDADNIQNFIRDVDLVIDGTDNMDTRYLINEACVNLGKPWVMIGVERWYGNVKLVVPEKTACLKCFIPRARARENACEIFGVTPIAVDLTVSVALSIAIKYLTEGYVDEHLYVVDAYSAAIERAYVRRNSSCPTCVYKRFDYLFKGGKNVKPMCGARAVKIVSESRAELDLEKLTKSNLIKNLRIYDGAVAYGVVSGFEVMILRNGKVFVKGTTDADQALKLYKEIIDSIK
ncbi:MAG: ThiF family adenylyltransferase [Ignisphaera sp.]